ncbi:hypothetical protein ACFYMW_26105 [Streptomyces sp. NPDC006692]|uniref:hypothetical protein n=1 Tax=unclassified Streptomyces TaxID=2593676 RepID=UPI003449B8D6
MPVLSQPAPPAAGTSPAARHQEELDQPPSPVLAEVLDLQETDVPRTAHALEHFFPEA